MPYEYQIRAYLREERVAWGGVTTWNLPSFWGQRGRGFEKCAREASPHGEELERLFSYVGWLHSPRGTEVMSWLIANRKAIDKYYGV
jgi:hypothetical protein